MKLLGGEGWGELGFVWDLVGRDPSEHPAGLCCRTLGVSLLDTWGLHVPRAVPTARSILYRASPKHFVMSQAAPTLSCGSACV